MDMAPEIKRPEKKKNQRQLTEMEKTYKVFKVELREFLAAKTISGLTWCVFLMINIANVCSVIYHAAPGWAWTTEVMGQDVVEGEVYGWYGLWYTCWTLAEPGNARYSRRCETVDDLEFTPEWWDGCASMATMALGFGLASYVLLMIYMWNTGLNRRLRILFPFVITAIGAGVCGLILFIVFCQFFMQTAFWCCPPEVAREIIQWKLWYCFYLCGIGTTLYIAAGIGGIFEMFEVIREKRKMKVYTGWMERAEETMTEAGMPFPIEMLFPEFENQGYTAAGPKQQGYSDKASYGGGYR